MVIDKEYYRQLGKAGIRLFFVICDTIWLKPNALGLFKEEAETILEVVPDAYIIPRIGLHPTNEWMMEHPEECCTYTDGSRPGVKDFFTESYITDMPHLYSLCSSVWQKDAGKALAETWKLLMDLPYANRIVGCFLAAGGTSEWYYTLPILSNGMTLGYSDAFKRWFSVYLTEEYGTDESLRWAWNMDNITLNDPPVPSFEKHYINIKADSDAINPPGRLLSNSDVTNPPPSEYSIGSFIDFDKNRQTFDFYRALHNGTAASIVYFAKIIKDMTPDRLVGAFYGSYGCTAFLNNGTCGGVLRILDSGVVDFLAAPGVYENRLPGGMEGQREFHDSFALRNMIYVVEQDTRTHMENAFFRDKFDFYDVDDSVNVMKREFGRNIADDTQAWWFDQLLGGRRFKHPALYDLISCQQKIGREAYSMSRKKPSEIALIFDEESSQVVSQRTSVECIEMLHNYEISRIGAPVDQYYHNDMQNPEMPDYKLYIFVNVFVLTDAERKIIHTKLRKNHATAVFMYASGLINPDSDVRLTPDNISELTGFHILMDKEERTPKFRILEHKATAYMQPRFLYGWFDRKRLEAFGNSSNVKSFLWPAFYPLDGEPVARFVNFDAPAISIKEAEGFVSIFYGAKLIRSDTIRSLAAYAGCHIYCDSDDVTYIGGKYITLHASSNGTKTLRFPAPVTLIESYEKRIYGESVTEIDIPMYLGETKMFRIE